MTPKEVNPPEAYAALTTDASAVMIDCRTRAEWEHTGIPDLSAIGKTVILETLVDEMGRLNQNFLGRVGEIAQPQTPIYIICRSGRRSAGACQMLAAHGYANTCNVAEGFEGHHNNAGLGQTGLGQTGLEQTGLGQTGLEAVIEGWKSRGLPWCQS